MTPALFDYVENFSDLSLLSSTLQSGENLVNCSDLDLDTAVSPISLGPSSISDQEPTVTLFEVEATYTDDLIFETVSPNGRTVKVYQNCALGSCTCVHLLDGIPSQLKPCRWASLILNDPELSSSYLDLLHHLTDGFPIVDEIVESYECENYCSITTPDVKPLMDKIVKREVEEGAISLVDIKPTCIHALGAVPKPDGNIRHITDCSRPRNISVNNHCVTLLEDFCFKSVNNVVEIVEQGSYMCVIDIKSAYCAVPIDPSHRTYQGFSWEWNGRYRWFQDNRLCFGSRLGPMYFTLISSFIHDVLTKLYNLKIVNYLDDFTMYNGSLMPCTFPEKWKRATIVPLPKVTTTTTLFE